MTNRSAIYSSVTKISLKPLNSIHHTALHFTFLSNKIKYKPLHPQWRTTARTVPQPDQLKIHSSNTQIKYNWFPVICASMTYTVLSDVQQFFYSSVSHMLSLQTANPIKLFKPLWQKIGKYSGNNSLYKPISIYSLQF